MFSSSYVAKLNIQSGMYFIMHVKNSTQVNNRLSIIFHGMLLAGKMLSALLSIVNNTDMHTCSMTLPRKSLSQPTATAE